MHNVVHLKDIAPRLIKSPQEKKIEENTYRLQEMRNAKEEVLIELDCLLLSFKRENISLKSLKAKQAFESLANNYFLNSTTPSKEGMTFEELTSLLYEVEVTLADKAEEIAEMRYDFLREIYQATEKKFKSKWVRKLELVKK